MAPPSWGRRFVNARRFLTAPRAMMILLGVALLTRGVHFHAMMESPLFWVATSDAGEHFRLASHLAAGDWLGRAWGPYHRPQLFPHLMALVYTVFGAQYWLTHVLQTLVDTAAVLLWYGVGRRVMPRVPAFLGALGIALYWPFIVYTTSGCMETTAMGLMALFLFVYLGLGRRRARWWHALGAGLLAGLCVMTRPTMLLTLPPLALLLMWRLWPRGAVCAMLPPALMAAGTIAVISVNLLRHLLLFGLWAPLGTNSELAFHMANNRDGWGWERSSPGVEFRVYQNLPLTLGDAEPTVASVRAWWARRNREYIQEAPLQFAAGLGLKLLQVMNGHEVHCAENPAYARSRHWLTERLPGFPVLGPLGFLGVLAVLMGQRRTFRMAANWGRLVLLVWMVVYIAGVALYLSVGRHRLPALPVMWLLGGWGLWRLVGGGTTTRAARFGLWGALVLGVITTRLPVIPEWYPRHEQWWTSVNRGVALMALDRPEEAILVLQEATRLMPEKPEGWLQLALACAAAGRPAEGVAAQQRVIGLLRSQYPQDIYILAEETERLGLLQLEAGELDSAMQTARRLVAENPDVAAPLVLLSRVYFAMGETDNARRAAEAARRLDPGNAAVAGLLSALGAD
jgi:tetratricopeptide (TPR) repeat protein